MIGVLLTDGAGVQLFLEIRRDNLDGLSAGSGVLSVWWQLGFFYWTGFFFVGLLPYRILDIVYVDY